MKERNLDYFSIVFLSVLALGQASYAQEPAAVTPGDGDISRSKLIHHGDLIEIDVIGSFEFDWRGTLNPEGFLDGMDKIPEQVFALCKSETDLAAEMETQLAKTLREPKVAVRILDRSNRAVAYLDGAVRFPHRFQIKRPVKLNELIILSGGITDTASGEISIFRPENLSCGAASPKVSGEFVNASRAAGAQTAVIKIADLLKGESDANPEILSGDIVSVVEALPVYIIGGVNAPKQISSRSQTTLSRAIASAGGVTKDAEGETVTIFRRGKSGPEVISADLQKIREGTAEDPQLMPFDIVDVPLKGKPKNRFAPVINTGGQSRSERSKLPLRIVE